MKQLTAVWSEDHTHALISRDGEPLASLPATISRHTHAWMKPDGNGKTAHGNVGVLSSIRNGCFRELTGCGRCSERCYKEAGKLQSGCYADCTTFAMIRWNSGFSVIHNGYQPGTEHFFSLTLPKNGYDLSMYPTKIYRVDSESATSCMSLALGLTQRWAQANPGIKFTGISSDYFRVPNDMLEWAASLGNIVIGHTLSPWFAADDLKNRIKEARRYEGLGVPTTIWVVTRPDWEETNRAGVEAIDAAIDRFDPRQIVRLGYHDRSTHEYAGGSENPWGVCCGSGVDVDGCYANMSTGVRTDGEQASDKLKGVCYGCKILCGVRWLQHTRKAA